MRIGQIRQMIAEGVRDESETGRFAQLVDQVAKQNGVAPTTQQLELAVAFVREYVEHVPMLLEQAEATGRHLGIGAELGQVLSELESYWFEAQDLIPDHLGLIGLADDAYATLFLLQGMSDYCGAASGRPLLQQNFTQANLAMRNMIGEPIVSTLEQRVGITLGNALMARMLSRIGGGGFSFSPARDPIWGNASIDEIVNVRLGAMGVI